MRRFYVVAACGMLCLQLLGGGVLRAADRDAAASAAGLEETRYFELYQNLGLVDSSGRGMSEEARQQYGVLLHDAEAGDRQSQKNLGIMLLRGEGYWQDFTEAAYWLKLAAEQGDLEAQSIYADLCANGLGAPQDRVEAYMWYRVVAQQGARQAKDSMVWVATEMSYDEINKAEQLAKEKMARF